jgi:hypothetical protein
MVPETCPEAKNLMGQHDYRRAQLTPTDTMDPATKRKWNEFMVKSDDILKEFKRLMRDKPDEKFYVLLQLPEFTVPFEWVTVLYSVL